MTRALRGVRVPEASVCTAVFFHVPCGVLDAWGLTPTTCWTKVYAQMTRFMPMSPRRNVLAQGPASGTPGGQGTRLLLRGARSPVGRLPDSHTRSTPLQGLNDTTERRPSVHSDPLSRQQEGWLPWGYLAGPEPRGCDLVPTPSRPEG